MQAGRQLRIRLLVQSWLFIVLFTALVMLLAYAAQQYRREWDVTRSARNTLSLNVAALPWKAPYPEAVLDEDTGMDEVMVRAVPTADLRINGHLMPAGQEVTLPCSVAHAHAANLAAPKE